MCGNRSGGLGARAVRPRSRSDSGAGASTSGGGGEGSSGRRLAELLQLRHHMSHLVTNLQIYIQVQMHPGSLFCLYFVFINTGRFFKM